MTKTPLTICNLALCLTFLGSNISFAATKLNFNEALKEIISRHTGIKVQQTNVEASDWSVFAKKTNFLPQLVLSDNLSSNISTNTQSPNSTSLTANINLFKWGADLKSLDAAQSTFSSQKNSLADVKLSAEVDAVTALVGVIENNQNVNIHQQDVESYRTYFEIANQRYSKGFLAQQEVDKVAIDFANAEARLKDAQAALSQAEAILEQLLGKTEIIPDWPWKEIIASRHTTELLSAHFNADDLPSIQASRDALAAEEANVSALKRIVLPSLGFSLSFSPSPSQDPTSPNFGSTTSLSLSMPLFNSFQDYSSYKIETQTFLALDYKYQQLRINAEAQWRTSQKQFSIAIATALAREKTLTISQRIFYANQQRFQQGRTTVNDLNIDRDRLIASQLLAIKGWSSAHTEFTNFCHSLGKSVSDCM